MNDAIKEALQVARKIISDDLETFIDNNSEGGRGGKLDRMGLTGYEREELERYERAISLIDAAMNT